MNKLPFICICKTINLGWHYLNLQMKSSWNVSLYLMETQEILFLLKMKVYFLILYLSTFIMDHSAEVSWNHLSLLLGKVKGRCLHWKWDWTGADGRRRGNLSQHHANTWDSCCLASTAVDYTNHYASLAVRYDVGRIIIIYNNHHDSSSYF